MKNYKGGFIQLAIMVVVLGIVAAGGGTIWYKNHQEAVTQRIANFPKQTSQKNNEIMVDSKISPAITVSPKDCNDFQCVIEAAKTCTSVKWDSTITVSFAEGKNLFEPKIIPTTQTPGDLEQTSRTLMEIRGIENGKCGFSQKLIDIINSRIPVDMKTSFLKESIMNCSYEANDLVIRLQNSQTGTGSISFSTSDTTEQAMKRKCDNYGKTPSSNNQNVDSTRVSQQSTDDIALEIADMSYWFTYKGKFVCHGKSLDDPACASLPVFEMEYPSHFKKALEYILGLSLETKDSVFVITDTYSNRDKFLNCGSGNSLYTEIFDTDEQRVTIKDEQYCVTKNVRPADVISYRYIKQVGNYYPGFSVNSIRYTDPMKLQKVREFLDQVATTIKVL
jgi:hypothetical protein